ncbi:WD40-repeat-containing domain protein [Blastocladiella britannica]|nr:WD40-repeat-containing domain protein [Blastocladiella britannica]
MPPRRSNKPAPPAPPSQIVVLLKPTDSDTPTGPPLSLSSATTAADLTLLLNTLLSQPEDEPLPYSFFVGPVEIVSSIAADIANLSAESQLTITYTPQALFRVRALTRCGATMAGHTDAVLSAHFGPRGDSLATGSGDHTVRLWDLATGTPKATWKAHTGWVLAVAWSPDGKWVASGGMDGLVCVWAANAPGSRNGGTIAPVATLKGHRDAVTALAWEPLSADRSAAAGCVRLASGSRDTTVRVWHVPTKRLEFAVTQHTKSVTAVKWGAENLLYTASRDCTIKVWDAADGKLVRSLAGHGHWVNTMALSTEAVLRTGIWDHTGTDPESVVAARSSASASGDAAAGSTAVARAIHLAAKARLTATHHGAERLVSGSDDFTMYLWTPASAKQPVARMTGHQALVNAVCFSASGARIASASFDKSVKVWDGITGTFLFSLRGHVSAVYGVVFSADERLVLSCSKDSTCKVWDMRSRKMKAELPGHADEVYAVDWAPHGQKAASASKDRTVKVWCQ